MSRPIYLDYNATTPVDPIVVEAMLPYLREHYGNASSAHAYGTEARQAVERARRQVAALLGARPSEIIFTGGGSETDNLAIKGAVFLHLGRRPHVVSCVSEHAAVLTTLAYLKHRFDVDYTLVPVDRFGMVSASQVRAAIRPETVLVTIMHANNEVGTVQPLAEIADITREAGVLFHADAAQTAGKIDVDVERLGVDMLTIAGHKLYAPKGVGALYMRRGVHIDPLVHGSSQERDMRAGTENVPGIVALGVAAELAHRDREESARLRRLRDQLYENIREKISGVQLNGHPEQRLPNTLNVSLPHVLGHSVLEYAPEVAASTGSACHSGTTDPSPVLLAMGLSRERALGALRLSLGRWSVEEELVSAASALHRAYEEVALIYSST